MSSETCDVIVIGCGGFGSSALCHLAQRGLNVIGIDRFHPPHERGSSHGETRLIRKAYFEHPDYVPLLHRAWDLWEELSEETRQRLIERRALMLSGGPGSVVTKGARESAKLHNLPLENLTHAEAQHRFPMFRLPDDHTVSLESTAGFLWVERCISASLEQAQLHGARLQTGELVQSVSASSSGLTVRTDRTTYSAGSGVLTCGAWTSQLLPDYSAFVTVLKKTLFWYPISSTSWSGPNGAPMFLFDLPDGMFYSPSCVDGQTLKIGNHAGGEAVPDPSALLHETLPEDEVSVQRFVSERLVGVDASASRSAVCMYSMSPDGHFLFDRLPDVPLVVAAGFSGHGFKFSSVLGEAAADLIQHGRSQMNIDFLSANRLRP